MSVSVRRLTVGDEAAWRSLWAGYLAYYKTELNDAVTAKIFRRLLTGSPHFAFVAEQNGDIVGFVHGLPHASTWSVSDYCYLEDLYVDKSVRGGGIGRALIEAVYAEADKRGCA
ncbi:MAG: GNAT family N-acetyltransferase, partial [Marinicaulis sp.]|nr:GNAT family N-acetyltransferase [Marinicaulis sp.]